MFFTLWHKRLSRRPLCFTPLPTPHPQPGAVNTHTHAPLCIWSARTPVWSLSLETAKSKEVSCLLGTQLSVMITTRPHELIKRVGRNLSLAQRTPTEATLTEENCSNKDAVIIIGRGCLQLPQISSCRAELSISSQEILSKIHQVWLVHFHHWKKETPFLFFI